MEVKTALKNLGEKLRPVVVELIQGLEKPMKEGGEKAAQILLAEAQGKIAKQWDKGKDKIIKKLENEEGDTDAQESETAGSGETL